MKWSIAELRAAITQRVAAEILRHKVRATHNDRDDVWNLVIDDEWDTWWSTPEQVVQRVVVVLGFGEVEADVAHDFMIERLHLTSPTRPKGTP